MPAGKCEVTRAAEGAPSLFFALYSPTGGVAEPDWADGMLSWIWVPLILCCYCVTRLATACPEEEDEEDAAARQYDRHLAA